MFEAFFDLGSNGDDFSAGEFGFVANRGAEERLLLSRRTRNPNFWCGFFVLKETFAFAGFFGLALEMAESDVFRVFLPRLPAVEIEECLHASPFGDFFLQPVEVDGLESRVS